MDSSSSQSPAPPADDHHGENVPTRTKRRYGASCELCRRRKRKCPGRDSQGNSLCTHCGEVGVKCVFPPNGSFLRAKKAVAIVASIPTSSEADNLRAYIRRLASANEADRKRMLDQWIDDDGSSNSRNGARKLPAKNNLRPLKTSGNNNIIDLSDDEDEERDSRSTYLPKASPPGSGTDPRPSKKLKLWNDGTQSPSRSGPQDSEDVEEEGEEGQQEEKSLRPESALRLSLKPATPDSSEATGEENEAADRSILSSTTLQANISAWVDYWVAVPFPGPDGIVSEGPSPGDRTLLFDNYFCWQGPRNGIVDKIVFERALEEKDSKYYSHFLLYAICAHTVRHIPQLRERVHEYAAKAHYLLASELSRPSSIPTVQGLLLLASHDAARGMYAQSWNLTSTAIAMMMDLGCHLDTKATSASSDRGSSTDSQREQRAMVQKKMRTRVFWSAFIWDKLISLALNRKPLLSSEEHAPPFPEPEESSEDWIPVLCADSPPALFNYTPQPSHELKCFYETSRANQFLDEIDRHLYRTQKMRSLQAREFVADMHKRLLRWQTEACHDVILELSTPSHTPPPPHILQLNLLVRLMWILLYRPFFYASASAEQSSSEFVPDAVSTCERAAIEINTIFTMYDRFYPLSRASYIVIFAAFLAATVDLALADRQKSVSGPTLSRLALAGRVLSGGSSNIPGMHSSVRCLQEHLHATLSRCNSWVPPPKSRKSSDHSAGPFGARATSVVCPPSMSNDSQNTSPPLASNQRSSTAPPDSQSDRSLGMPGLSASPISIIPSSHDSASDSASMTPSPIYPSARSSSTLSSSGLLSPTDATTPHNILHDSPQNDYYSPANELKYVYQAEHTTYMPQTPDQEMVDHYIAGSQVSHYESGWNAFFWPSPGQNNGAYAGTTS